MVTLVSIWINLLVGAFRDSKSKSIRFRVVVIFDNVPPAVCAPRIRCCPKLKSVVVFTKILKIQKLVK